MSVFLNLCHATVNKTKYFWLRLSYQVRARDLRERAKERSERDIRETQERPQRDSIEK